MLKILVIDDTELNLAAARIHFANTGEYELTTCATHEEAMDLLYPKCNEAMRASLEAKYEEEFGSSRAYRMAEKESRLPYWDVVLCDLNMPAHGPSADPLKGTEMMIGWQLALIAAKNGAKFVAVVTNGNHHRNLTSAMMDSLSGGGYWNEYGPAEFVINGAKVGFWHDPNEDDEDYTGKGWDKVLAKLLK